MKPALTYVVLWVVTLVLAVQVVLVLYYLKPEAFTVLNSPQAAQVAPPPKPADSIIAKVDSLRTEPKDSVSFDVKQVTVVSASSDSLKLLSSKLNAEIQKEELLEKKVLTQTTGADSAYAKEIKGTAKLLESMSAENAAKILQNLKLSEARQVLMAVKKKQAGKILSAMEPKLAAKMIR